MRQYFKYFSSFSIISLADKVVLSLSNSNVQPDNGFGNEYKWQSLTQGFKQAKHFKKPIFLVVHKLTCPACIELKDKFSKSIKLIELSRCFVMINIENDSELIKSINYSPDGTYVPRVLFFTPEGKLILNAYNRHQDADEEHKYFYSSPSQIIKVMQQVIDNDGRNPLPEI